MASPMMAMAMQSVMLARNSSSNRRGVEESLYVMEETAAAHDQYARWVQDACILIMFSLSANALIVASVYSTAPARHTNQYKKNPGVEVVSMTSQPPQPTGRRNWTCCSKYDIDKSVNCGNECNTGVELVSDEEVGSTPRKTCMLQSQTGVLTPKGGCGPTASHSHGCDSNPMHQQEKQYSEPHNHQAVHTHQQKRHVSEDTFKTSILLDMTGRSADNLHWMQVLRGQAGAGKRPDLPVLGPRVHAAAAGTDDAMQMAIVSSAAVNSWLLNKHGTGHCAVGSVVADRTHPHRTNTSNHRTVNHACNYMQTQNCGSGQFGKKEWDGRLSWAFS